MIDPSESELAAKTKYFLKIYDRHDPNTEDWDDQIKWSRNLKVKLVRKKKEAFSDKLIRRYAYRPYVAFRAYLSELLIDELGQLSSFTGIDLLMRVTRVSVETMEIVEAMKKEKR